MSIPTTLRAITARARLSLTQYIVAMDPTYQVERCHRHIIDLLEKVDRGEVKRLIITMPPRHGKTRLVAQDFAAWCLGRKPQRELVVASYATRLSEESVRKTREKLSTTMHRLVFPHTDVVKGADRVGNFCVRGKPKDGGYRSVGIGSGLSGHGADILIVDDPINSPEEAMSETQRQKIWDWYIATARSRLSPDGNGAVIVIMTRWHDDDLVGRLLADEEKAREAGELTQDWVYVNLPAEAEDNDPLGRAPGEWLSESRIPASKYLEDKASSSVWWTALYQGHPKIDGGDFMGVDSFEFISPADLESQIKVRDRAAFVDLAYSDSRSSDSTAIAWGFAHKGALYVEGASALKREYDMAREYIAQLVTGLKVSELGVEGNGPQKGIASDLKSYLAPQGCFVRSFPSMGGKIARLMPVVGLAAKRKVFIVGHPNDRWVTALVTQLEAFPTGKHDDLVDALSGLHHLTIGRYSTGVGSNAKVKYY